jgi:diguanylate cyclase (GGDEF)-like protein
LELAAGFGRWWFDPDTSQMVISAVAAQYLSVEPGHHSGLDSCFIAVVLDDLLPLISHLTTPQFNTASVDFRVISPVDGLHWLRMTGLPADPSHPGMVSGILVDVTPAVHATMRERLGFELTEFLVGSHSLGDSITNIIQLICKTLGWDWGAYWGMESSPQGTQQLSCKYLWHHPELDLDSFQQESSNLLLAPGQGLVGSVWESSHPDWVEDMANDLRFSQRTGDRNCKLWSGYAFPVIYASEDGQTHSPGVLEFYSSLQRQPEAQLPRLSKVIGALIAQMAQRLEQQATILHLAQVDGLTGLSNRSHFHSQLTQACAHATSKQGGLRLIFIDLDRFKPINDAFGHEAGNVVLREFAHRLRALAPNHASLGRLGGDEFAVLLADGSSAEATALTDLILQAARTPFVYDGAELTVSASIGVSSFPENGVTCPELLQSADAAMYRIKNNGRNASGMACISTPTALAQQQSSMAERLTLEAELHHALQAQELFVVYQPIVDIARDHLHSIEALIRWRRADGALVAPDVFIPIAEQSHLIVQIGKWVVAQVCSDLATLRASNLKNVNAHVNMAASEFTSASLPTELLAQLALFDLAPGNLTLELTEGMLMKRPDQVIPVMRALRHLGFGISLDDFGMGHSSLSLLKNLPITSLKVDRSFVRDLQQQGNDRAIVKTIVDLGKQMGLSVIAEGVETQSQLSLLRQCDCTLIQGYLLGRPMGVADLIQKYAKQ